MLSIIDENLVIIKDKCKSRNKILKEMVNALYKQKRIDDVNKFYKAILEREKIQTTAVGNEIAIPHTKLKEVRLFSVVIAICRNGVDFKALDKKDVKIIFMVSAPQDFTKSYLQLIAKIARILRNKKWKDKFLKAKTKKEVIDILYEFDKTYPDRLKLNKQEGILMKKNINKKD